jgi:histone-lysine N-methyltransferase SETMAR
MNGPFLEHYREKGETVNSANYSTMLEEKLKPAIRSRRRGLQFRGVLLHDNERPHTAAAKVTTIQKPKFETINHPPYIPDLAPSDCDVFEGSIEKTKISQRRRDEGGGALLASTTSKNFFFSTGIEKLVGRCEKCIVKDCDYVEK